MNSEHAQTAMKIILHAGDAREKTMDALKALDTFDIENAKELLKQRQMKLLYKLIKYKQMLYKQNLVEKN